MVNKIKRLRLQREYFFLSHIGGENEEDDTSYSPTDFRITSNIHQD
jgi:hypothetical protein